MSKELTHKEISSIGGQITFTKYGREFMSKNGKKGSAYLLKKYGPDYFIELAAKGLAARLKKSKSNKPISNN
jgi:hypothetical protein